MQRRPAYLSVSPHCLPIQHVVFSHGKREHLLKWIWQVFLHCFFQKSNAKVNILVKVYVLNRFLTFVTTSTRYCWRMQFWQVHLHLTAWSICVLVHFGQVEHWSWTGQLTPLPPWVPRLHTAQGSKLQVTKMAFWYYLLQIIETVLTNLHCKCKK